MNDWLACQERGWVMDGLPSAVSAGARAQVCLEAAAAHVVVAIITP